MDSNEQKLAEQIVKFRGSSEITCPHISGVRLRQDCSLCWTEFIRSHADALIAAAIEECAKKIARCQEIIEKDGIPRAVGEGLACLRMAAETCKNSITLVRSLTPPAVRRALELRDVKAKIDEAKDYTIVVRAMVESPRAHKRCLKECEQHLADLERRREELEGDI